MTDSQTSASRTLPLTVFFDGGCPLCRREIGVYSALESSKSVLFVDVCTSQSDLPAGLDQRQLLSRFHVRDGAGVMHSGPRAFLLLWSVLTGWRWWVHVERVPGAMWIMERTYSAFLYARPLLQRVARLRVRSRST